MGVLRGTGAAIPDKGLILWLNPSAVICMDNTEVGRVAQSVCSAYHADLDRSGTCLGRVAKMAVPMCSGKITDCIHKQITVVPLDHLKGGLFCYLCQTSAFLQ
jgi:hypothetical protein